jgi:ParB-like chromosome segregation protein Spo0J
MESLSESPALAALSTYQTFEMATIHRSKLLNATYNPRTLSPAQKRRLKKIIAKHGLVAPIVWNVRTGNIVGGHQRISILDSLEGKGDYSLTVAQIDVDDKQEKEINLALNNQMAQGEWDLAKLEPLMREVDLEGTGFDQADLIETFGAELTGGNEEAEKMEKEIAALKEKDAKIRKMAEDRDDHRFYRVLVFGSPEEAAEWAKASELDPEEMFYGGRGTKLVHEGK